MAHIPGPQSFKHYSLVAALSALLVSSPTFPQSYEEVCEIFSVWDDIEGRSLTAMLVRQNQADFENGDEVLVAFTNDDWSITDGEVLGRIRVENEDGDWFENDAFAVEHGFVIATDFEKVEFVFGGMPQALILTRSGQTIDQLSQSGILSEWVKFRSCRAKKVTAKAEFDRKDRLAREIPKDPFAN